MFILSPRAVLVVTIGLGCLFLIVQLWLHNQALWLPVWLLQIFLLVFVAWLLAHEVDERRRSEAARLRSEEKFIKLFHASPGAIALTRQSDGRFLEVNDAMLQMTGFSREEMLGRTSVELGVLTAEGRARMLANAATPDVGVGREGQFRNKAGQVIDVIYSLDIVTVHDEPCLLLSVLDVTARKQLELELQRSQAMFRTIFDASPVAIALSRLDDGRFLAVNAAYTHLTGYDAEELVGRTSIELGILAADSRAQLLTLIQAQGYARGIDLQVVTKVNTVVDTLCVIEVVEANNAPCLLSLVIDISERRRMEHELRRLNEELEARVTERTASLEVALLEAESAARLKAEFMAMISHELRTPLMGVLSLTELLADEIAGPLNQRQAEYVRGVAESGGRLLEVVDEIISYTQLLAGMVVLEHQPIALAYLLNTCAAARRSAASARQQTIQVHVAPADLIVASDATALAEVIKRLLENAVKFTPLGGQVGIEAHAGATPGSVQIVVWDTGIGLAADQFEHVVKPFTQADGSLARDHEGIGMGLAYVYQMILFLGGQFELESERGHGSRFTITLPTQPLAAPAQARSPVS